MGWAADARQRSLAEIEQKFLEVSQAREVLREQMDSLGNAMKQLDGGLDLVRAMIREVAARDAQVADEPSIH